METVGLLINAHVFIQLKQRYIRFKNKEKKIKKTLIFLGNFWSYLVELKHQRGADSW